MYTQRLDNRIYDEISEIAEQEGRKFADMAREIMKVGLMRYREEGNSSRGSKPILSIVEKRGIYASIESVLYLRKIAENTDPRILDEVKKEAKQLYREVLEIDDSEF